MIDKSKPPKQRRAAPGKRHRQDNGPEELQVDPVPPPTRQELGVLHTHTEELIESGPQALLKAHHRASKLSIQFGEELVDQWRLETPWLKAKRATYKGTEQANYAMRWRPTFLAAVALSHSTMIGCRASGVTPPTVIDHRKSDPDFDAQVIAAQDHCIELLHAVTMRSALEGDLEPVFWQGIQVGHIKKFDNRLRIELLRAHLPTKFKTPGAHSALVSGDGNNVLVIDAATRAELVALRREALDAMALKQVNALPPHATDASNDAIPLPPTST